MEPQILARRIVGEIAALRDRSTESRRAVRRRASSELRSASADEVRAVARALIVDHRLRWMGY